MWTMVHSQRIFLIRSVEKIVLLFISSIECRICDVMGICGVCKSGTKRAVSTGSFKPSSFLSVRAADRCLCCRNPAFPRGGATADFQSAGFGSVAIVLKFLLVP